MAAFAALVARHETRLFNFLLRRVRSREDAEDLTQDAFVRAWKRLDRYDNSWKFSTWLFTIAARMASSHGRSKGRRKAREADHAGGAGELAPDDGAMRTEARGRLWSIAESCLSETAVSMLWLRYVEDMSMREIARALGRTEVGVRVALFRAREALERRLREDGIGLEGEQVRRVEAGAPARENRPALAPAGGV